MARTDDLRVLLVRSGPTDWDDAGRLQGDTDLPLSDCGRDAFAARVASVASDPAHDALDVVLHGPDECSGQSGRILAAQLGVRARQVEDLREMDLGLWEGMRESELLERHPTVYKQWRADPTSVTPPDGDTLADAEARSKRAPCISRSIVGPWRRRDRPSPDLAGSERCWLTGRPLDDLWEVVSEAPEGEWFTVARERLKELAVESRRGLRSNPMSQAESQPIAAPTSQAAGPRTWSELKPRCPTRSPRGCVALPVVQMIYRKQMEANLHVCPQCDHHFRITAAEPHPPTRRPGLVRADVHEPARRPAGLQRHQEVRGPPRRRGAEVRRARGDQGRARVHQGTPRDAAPSTPRS